MAHGDVQNYAYAFQWWIFIAFGIAMWLRIIDDQAGAHEAKAAEQRDPVGAELARMTAAESAHSKPDAPTAYRRYVMPQSSTAEAPPVDAVLSDYNDYLAGLSTSTGRSRRFDPDAPPAPHDDEDA